MAILSSTAHANAITNKSRSADERAILPPGMAVYSPTTGRTSGPPWAGLTGGPAGGDTPHVTVWIVEFVDAGSRRLA